MKTIHKITVISVTLCALTVLSGCSNMSRRDKNTAIGAGVGAVAGAATDPCDVNLGDPIWKNDRGAYERRCGRSYRDR